MSEVTINLSKKSERDLRLLARSLSPEQFLTSLQKVMDRQAQIAAGAIVKSEFGAGANVRTRSGNLAQSIVGDRNFTVGGIPAIRVGVFTGPALSYAAAQEFGTQGLNSQSPIPTIRPTDAKALAVPVEPGPAVTPSGVTRFSSPVDFPEPLQFVPIRSNNVIGALLLKEDLTKINAGEITFQDAQRVYLLLDQVDLPEKAFLRKGFDKFLPRLVENLEAAISGAIEGS